MIILYLFPNVSRSELLMVIDKDVCSGNPLSVELSPHTNNVRLSLAQYQQAFRSHIEQQVYDTQIRQETQFVEPGQTVRPAHCHPKGEEMLYIINGSGKVYIDGIIYPFREGSVILFEQGKVHMVRNTGSEELKVACFFAPATDLESYEYHPKIDFDGGKEL